MSSAAALVLFCDLTLISGLTRLTPPRFWLDLNDKHLVGRILASLAAWSSVSNAMKKKGRGR
jgi:hypothetical protein